MLNILFMILKIAGIIIAAILGLIILLILIVLFVPLRYRLDGSCDGTMDSLKVKVKCSWLLHLFSAYYVFENKKSDWQARIAWKKLNVPGKETPVEEKAVQEENIEEIEKEIADEKSSLKKETKQMPSEEPAKKETFIGKVKAFFQKIKYTFQKMCDKIKLLIEKKEKALEFIDDAIHRNAFVKAKTEIIRLCRFLKPRKLQGRIHYGFDDPYITGKVLAGASIFYPFYGDRLLIEPDFEEQVFEGEVHIRGCVWGIHAVIIVCNIIVHKDIRTTFKHIKEFQL